MWFLLFLLAVLLLSALAFSLYHSAICRYEQKVIEEYEETRREQQRRRRLFTARKPPCRGQPILEFAAAPDEEFDAACAETLAQLELRRKALRRSQRFLRR